MPVVVVVVMLGATLAGAAGWRDLWFQRDVLVMRILAWLLPTVVCGTCLISSAPSQAENWPRFRGTDGSGVAPEQGIPTKWQPTDYAWQIEIPGIGHGAPVIWGPSLFVTSAVNDGLERSLLCLDADSGELKWSRTVGFNTHQKHEKNSYASSTPVTDGERVYVAFADRERYAVAAYSMEGDLVWRNWLGPYTSQHGLGASPIIFEDLLIVPNDQDGPSAIVALDRRNGQLVWSSLRDFREASYATPLIIEPPGSRPQLICVSGATGITSLDPWTGAQNWFTEPMPKRTVASPVYAAGLVFATCGQGGKGDLLIGVDPLKINEDGSANVVYKRDKSLPYVPTIIGYGDHLYIWNDNSIVVCLDPKTDTIVWQERLGGKYTGSPLCIGGKLYCMSEEGLVGVVDASPTFKLYEGGDLGDPSHSTPAVANGKLYLRSFHKLACLPAPGSTGGK